MLGESDNKSIISVEGDLSRYKNQRGYHAIKRSLSALYLCFGLSVAILAIPQRAQGMLGESADSVTSDTKALSAVEGAKSLRNGYAIQEIHSDSITIREYVSSAGIVFGIAWNGLIHPDLTLLMGSYAAEYQEAKQRIPRRPGHRPYQVVKTNRIVVEKWGHMRNLQGRAYAPALIPPAVSIDEIQ
jgi:hypothetical protein